MANKDNSGGLFGGIMGFFNTITGLFGEVMKWGGIIGAGVAIFAMIGKFFGGDSQIIEDDTALEKASGTVTDLLNNNQRYKQWLDSPTASAAPPKFSLPFKGDGRVSGVYGEERKTHKHTGTDFAASGNMLAMGEGEVLFVQNVGSAGNVIVIGHAGGLSTRYYHLSGVNVKVGDHVAQAQEIGAIGSSGRSTGVHAHVEIRDKNNNPLDTETYIYASNGITLEQLIQGGLKTGRGGSTFKVVNSTTVGSPLPVMVSMSGPSPVVRS